MNITYERPIRAMAPHGWVEPLFKSLFDGWESPSESGIWGIPINVKNTEDEVVVSAALPGVKPKDITTTVDGGMLTIKARTSFASEDGDDQYAKREVRTGDFERSIHLPKSLDVKKAISSYKDGLLTITLPRAEESKPHQIKLD